MSHGTSLPPTTLDGAWVLIDRTSAHRPLSSHPEFTVVSTVPGWGRTTWMRQCDNHLRVNSDARTAWLDSRRAVEDFCANVPVDLDVVFVDDVLTQTSDPLWQALTALTQKPHKLRVVVSSLDLPPRLPTADVHVLTEQDLAFTPQEVDALAAANSVSAPAGLYGALTTHYRGSPALARRHLQGLGAHTLRMGWANTNTRLNIQFAAELLAALLSDNHAGVIDSTFAHFMKHASMFRRVTLDLVNDVDNDPSVAAEYFARLIALPFGNVVIDEETGQTAYEWHEQIWALIERDRRAGAYELRMRTALDVTHKAGHLAMKVFYLVRLEEFATADALVYNNFRYFLLATHDVTVRALQDIPWDELSKHPSLLLLLGELRVRATGSAAEAAMYNAAALKAFQPRQAHTPFERLRLTGRRAFASAGLGERADARRYLKEVAALLSDTDGPGVVAETVRDPHVAEHLAAEMYLPFWAATQIDDHAMAATFTTAMRTYANPRSHTAVAEHLVALAEELLIGTHAPDIPDLTAATTSPIACLERGDDDQARELISMLTERIDSSPSRTGAEALVLVLQALVAPDALSTHDLESPLERSRRFWKDGKPGTQIVATTAFAYLSLGNAARAREILREAPHSDWFVTIIQAVVLLAVDRAQDALVCAEQASRMCEQPRARVHTRVVAAVALQRLGRQREAIEQLEAGWHAGTPGILRLALRFVSQEDYDEFVASSPRLNENLAHVLHAAQGDARHLTRTPAVEFTRVDLENLALLRERLTNTEIAERRFVSVNTVRTQVRMLLRRLGVSNRADAVVRAAQLGAFDEG